MLPVGSMTQSSGKVPMTQQGKKLLEEELKNLLTVERPAIVKAIEVARGHGDLSENADYSAAKERQSFIEGRIQEINSKLARAEVIQPSLLKGDRIMFGATVLLEDHTTGKQVTYQIVGVDEANLKAGKISVTSPLARAMIGKKEGEDIKVQAPKGMLHYEVIQVLYQ